MRLDTIHMTLKFPSQKRNCELMSVCVYGFRNCLARGVGRKEDCPIGSGRGQATETVGYLSFILRIQSAT